MSTINDNNIRKFLINLKERIIPGPKGDKGDKGDTGAVGPVGSQGLQGIQGVPGTGYKSRVSGRFTDRNLVAGTYASSVDLTPLVSSLSGDTSMVSGKRFVATKSGLYILRTYGGRTPTATDIRFIISYNREAPHVYTDSVDVAFHTGTLMPTLTGIKYMNAGDYLVVAGWATTAITTIQDSGVYMQFEFVYLG